MKIIELSEMHKPLYFKCLIGDEKRLEDSGGMKEVWFEKMKDRGLKVKLALSDNGEPAGMIQYLPIEESFASGEDLYILYCIWVLNDPEVSGNHQKQGYGSALLEAFESDAKQSGKKGTAVWGLSIPAFMRAKWFKKRGYEIADRDGIRVLLWKHWDDDKKPAWIGRDKSLIISKEAISCFINGWCPEINKTFTRVKRALSETGSNIKLEEFDTSDSKTFIDRGMTDALFIAGKEIPLGPSPSYKKILRKVKNADKKLKK